jgi:hypothetical protein
MWSASGDEGGNYSGVSTISLGRLQYIWWVAAGPTWKKEDEGEATTVQLVGEIMIILINAQHSGTSEMQNSQQLP